jgi:hypothetical protein
MTVIETVEFRVDDVTMRCWPCQHCSAVATEGDALEAIAAYKKKMGIVRCAICSLEVRHESWEIMHTVDGGVAIWFASPSELAIGVILRAARHRAGVGAVLHEECVRRAVPYLSKEFWEETGIERHRSMWSPPLFRGRERHDSI